MTGLVTRDVETLADAAHAALRCNCDSGEGDRMIAEEIIDSGAVTPLADAIEALAEDPVVMRAAIRAQYGNVGTDATASQAASVLLVPVVRALAAALRGGSDD